MRNKHLKDIYLFLLFFSSFFIVGSGCISKENLPYASLSNFIEFGSHGMQPSIEYVFSPFDSISKIDKDFFSIMVVIRYSERCRIRSLPLNIEYLSATDSIISKNLLVNLFHNDGTVVGYGNYGIYEVKFPLLNEIKPSPEFFVSISTQEKATSGIISLGLITNILKK